MTGQVDDVRPYVWHTAVAVAALAAANVAHASPSSHTQKKHGKPKPLAQLQSSAKKRVATHGGSAPEPIAAAPIAIEPSNRDSPAAGPRPDIISVRAPRAILAQPRAPPSSRSLTPAV